MFHRYEPLVLREIIGVIVICAVIAAIAILVFFYELWARKRQLKKIHDAKQQNALKNVFTMQIESNARMEDTVGIAHSKQSSDTLTPPTPMRKVGKQRSIKVLRKTRRIKVSRKILYDIDMY
jgi:hypothetical protein